MALNDVVKNEYTFANILSQAHHSHVKQWDLHSFNNALKWAKFCMKVEESTRDKLYRDELDRHIRSLTVLLNPVSLLQIDLAMLKDSMLYLCKALCKNPDTPSKVLVALKNMGKDYYDQGWLNDAGKYLHTSHSVFRLIGDDVTFIDKDIHLLAKHIVQRLTSLLDACTYTQQRFERFLEKVFNELEKIDTGWVLIVNMLLTLTDCNTWAHTSDQVLQKLVVLVHTSAKHSQCGLWRCDRELVCRVCSYDDEILDLYINYIWTHADRMQPEYGWDDNANLYRWRPTTDVGEFTYSSLIACLHRLIISHPRHVHKLKTDLKHRSQSSYFNIYTDLINSLCDIEDNDNIL